MADQNKISISAVGLNLDADPTNLEQGEYTYALNATISHRTGGAPFIGNDEGNVKVELLPAGYQIVGQRKLNKNDTALLLASPTGDSEIGLFAKKKYHKIVNDPALAFDIKRNIQVKYKLNYKGERIIYFTADKQHSLFFNIDNPNFLKTIGPDGCELINTDKLDIDYMRIFKNYIRPCMKVIDVVDMGRLISGSYFITSQYADANSNGLSAWFPLIGPIPIFKDSLSQSNETIAGMNSEQMTEKAIVIKITNADTSFSHMNIGIVRVTNGVKRPFRVATINIGTTEYLYTGAGTAETAVELAEMVQPPVSYKSAKTIETTDSELLLGNLRSDKIFNFQPYVSKLQVQFQLFKAWSDDTKNSFKNPLFSTYMRVFRQDEVYGLGLTLEMIDGTETTWHIPGRRKNTMSNGEPFADRVDQFGNMIPGAEWDSKGVIVGDDIIDPSKIERYQNYNTAIITGSISTGALEGFTEYGEMSYWESTEKYDCDKDIWGEDAGQPIRHHKMPDSTLFHIHDGLLNDRDYNERVKLNYLGVRLPNIDEVLASLPVEVRSKVKGWRLAVADRTYNKSVQASGIMLNARKQNWRYKSDLKDDVRLFPNYPLNDLRPDPYIAEKEIPFSGLDPSIMPQPFIDYKKDTFFFHSPDTHFKKSFLNNGELKITAEIYGKTDSYYEYVEPYPDFKEKGDDNDKAAIQGTSIATYNNYRLNPMQQTRRKLKDAFYVPFNSKVGGGNTGMPIWNVFRESSVMLSITKDIEDPKVKDNSRFILVDTDEGLDQNERMNKTFRNKTRKASIYYATVKNNIPNQYGSIHDIRYNDSYACSPIENMPDNVVFAGDTYIGPMSLKFQHAFYQNIQEYMEGTKGLPGADFRPAETIAHTMYYYRNRGGSVNPRNQSRMMAEDNQGHGIFGIGGDGNATGLGWLALMMFGVPNFWAESDLNICLRQPGETADQTFYNNMNQGLYKMTDWLGIKTIKKDNSFLVNEDYSAKNDIKLIQTVGPNYDPIADEDTHYSTRVINSLRSQPEDIQDNWIRFRPLDYEDLPKTRGELVDIRFLGNYRTIFRMEQGIYLDNLYSKLGTSSGELSIGNGKMFEKPPTEMISTEHGYAGTCSQFAFINTPWGAFFVSPDQGKVFSIGERVMEITKGLQGWFEQNLPFTLDKQINVLSKDNASNPEGIGIISTWDDEQKRWLLTKKDYSIIDPENIPKIRYVNGQLKLDERAVSLHDEDIFENKSWTLSYYPTTQRWISWHSFMPGVYISQDLATFSIEGNRILHHNQAGIYHTYDGVKYPFIVENTDKIDGINSFVNPYISFITRTMGKNDESKMVTFNKAHVFNLYESSGILDLVIQDENDLSQIYKILKTTNTSREVALRIREGHFNFSDFYNIVKGSQHFNTSDWANADYRKQYPIDQVVNHEALDYDKLEGDYGLLRERWLKYRLILDNRHDLKLLLQFVLIANRNSIS